MAQPTIRLAVDAVVFGYESSDGLSVLLIKRKIDPFKGKWALPGGLVQTEEALEDAVQRELEEETGVAVDYLEQLYTFGTPGRDPRNRVVSVAYYGLVKPSHFKLQADTDAAEADWFKIDRLPPLSFDHNEILDTAIKRLKAKLSYAPIGFELLDDKFPFSELHKLYETVYGTEIDRRNFKKKFLQLDILEELNEKTTGKGRPGSLFKFKKEKYDALLKNGMSFDI